LLIFGCLKTLKASSDENSDGETRWRPRTTFNGAHRSAAWLESRQNPDGSWGIGDKSITTALCLLALSHQALVPNNPLTAWQKRTAVWLQNEIKNEAGHFRRNPGKDVRLSFLLEIYALKQYWIATREASIHNTIREALHMLLKVQLSNGGWKWSLKNKSDDELSMVFMFLILNDLDDPAVVKRLHADKIVAFDKYLTAQQQIRAHDLSPIHRIISEGLVIIAPQFRGEKKLPARGKFHRSIKDILATPDPSRLPPLTRYVISHICGFVGGDSLVTWQRSDLNINLFNTQNSDGTWPLLLKTNADGEILDVAVKMLSL